jgi:hypothetical protein
MSSDQSPPQPPPSNEEADRQPQFESAEAQQAFNSAVLVQLQARPAEPAGSVVAAPVDAVSLHLNTVDQTNLHTIRCRFCSSKVLLPAAGTYVSQEHQMHPLGGAKSEGARDTLLDWWIVPSQMNFENVGVTRAVDPSYRYLTCCDCEKGPIGINYLNEPNKFYVAHARVRYDA